ncbi:hypothetical protein RKD55_004743 [Rossellomorea marisflavi]
METLLTTVISSTAALVAIIGGFLVSRVIAIASEQGGVQRKMREINNDIEAKEGLKDSAINYLFEDDLYDFVDNADVIEGIIRSKDLETIVEEAKYELLSIEELRPHYNLLREIQHEIMYREIFSLEELKETHGLKHPERLYWYECIMEGLETMREEKRSGSLLASHFTLRPMGPPRNNHEYLEKKKELGQLEAELTILGAQKEEQEHILEDFGKPKYVMSGLGVLAYAAIVGIIYPSTLLPYSTNTYDDTLTKWWVLSLFFSHIMAIFTYLFMAMKGLSSNFEGTKDT